MYPFYRMSVLAAVFVSLLQPVLAMKAVNTPATTQAPPAKTNVVERGGTVTGVDLTNKTISVDGVKYILPTLPINVHTRQGGKGSDKISDLKPGMQIRFNTSRENFSAQQQVVDIWITRQASPSAKQVK